MSLHERALRLSWELVLAIEEMTRDPRVPRAIATRLRDRSISATHAVFGLHWRGPGPPADAGHNDMPKERLGAALRALDASLSREVRAFLDFDTARRKALAQGLPIGAEHVYASRAVDEFANACRQRGHASIERDVVDRIRAARRDRWRAATVDRESFEVAAAHVREVAAVLATCDVDGTSDTVVLADELSRCLGALLDDTRPS